MRDRRPAIGVRFLAVGAVVALLGCGLLWAAHSALAATAGPPDPLPRPEIIVSTAAPVPPDLSAVRTAPARIHPALRRALATAGPDDYLPIIIEWAGPDVLAGQPALLAAPTDRVTQRRQVIAALQAGHQQAAAALHTALTAAVAAGQARQVRAFWISPVIALQARPALIADLAGRPDVVALRLDAAIPLQQPTFETVAGPQPAAAPLWNLAMMRADLATDLGLDGAGVVVANLDTGVDWQHPALLAKYRGYRERGPAVHRGNWHVSTNEPYLYPGDGNGHGTHTMGTIVGDDGMGNRIGVAPGATWIAVKLFTNDGFTYESWIHDAFEWIMAPEGDPALAPDIVNNSWGSEEGANEAFRQDVRALIAAGILPIFAAGNNGPRPGSVNSPASYPEALAVAALDAEGQVTTFSARGPSPWGDVKPEVAAPGARVLSAFPGGGWAEGTGTSMAAPHVAGLAALLRQALPAASADLLAALILETARPLAEDIPNNDTGYGLIDAYAAALRVTPAGEIIGRVLRPDGGGIARSQVTAIPHAAGLAAVTTTADATGAFTLALRPGLYDIEGRAFGFAVGRIGGIQVDEGQQRSLSLTLTALPVGSVFGRVTDRDTTAPLSATVTVEATPVQAQSDPTTGLYSLALPEGAWTLRFVADAHRIVRHAITVTPGTGQALDVALPPGPRILLVDSGPWYYGSQIGYFTEALEALDYPFTLWPIRSPMTAADLPGSWPGVRTLRGYDLVLWSAPLDAPGLVGAADALRIYLNSGGRLLLSGQDIAYFDGGGTIFEAPQPYFFDLLGLRWEDETALAALTGVATGPLAGITITLNTADSARNQWHPDQVSIRPDRLTRPLLRWPGGQIGGAFAADCRPFRAAWLGFGLEGAGPRAVRLETLDRLLDWAMAAPAPYGMTVTVPSTPLIGAAGSIVTRTLQVRSTAALSDTVDVEVTGGPWPLLLILPDGSPAASAGSFPLDSCVHINLELRASIPAMAAVHARSVYTLTFRSRGDPTQVQTATVTVKTPAPVLFVDDERWYHHQDRYFAALNALGLDYDVFDTGGGNWGPPADTLHQYPLTIWTTGYDWHSPLNAAEEDRLAAYLDVGGRLLLIGQDILDVSGLSDFVRERLGVLDAMLSVTTTEVLGLPAGPLGDDLGPWRLVYPFTNWSDAVTPRPGAQGILLDQHPYIVGVANGTSRWRTVFFPFPLEALDEAPRQTLLGRTTLWLSPLGESRLQVPPFAAAGGRVPVTLTLGLATDAPRAGLAARLPLPAGMEIAPDSVRGPWRYDAGQRALTWTGALTPGVTLTLGADLRVPTGIPAGQWLPLRAELDAGAGLTVTATADLFVDVPWLTAHEEVTPARLWPGQTAQFTITVRNRGLLATTARLTDTLPSEIRLVAESAWASRGAVTQSATRVRWSDVLAPGEQAQIGFRGVISPTRPPGRVADRADITDDRGRRIVAWAEVAVPAQVYLPVIWR